jgi:hypothetical protein
MVCVVVNDALGAPLGAPAMAEAPVPLAPRSHDRQRLVNPSSACRTTWAEASAVDAVAVRFPRYQTASSSGLQRPRQTCAGNGQVCSPIDGGPSEATKATSSSPATAVPNGGVVTARCHRQRRSCPRSAHQTTVAGETGATALPLATWAPPAGF